MPLLRPLSMILIACFTGLCISQQLWAGTLSTLGSSRWVSVGKISDGDTFKTDDGEKVRLLGINTPETAYGSKPGQTLGQKAKKQLKSLIQGKLVRLEFDEEKRDAYGRTLAHLYLRDGNWINAAMVEAGLAHVYTFAPNFRYSDDLLAIEREARREKTGIWNTSRFKLLKSNKVSQKNIGQFRLVSGQVDSIKRNRWGFKLGRLSVSVPRAYRKWFKTSLKLQDGDNVIVRGKIRISSKGNLFLALHSPYDLEMVK